MYSVISNKSVYHVSCLIQVNKTLIYYSTQCNMDPVNRNKYLHGFNVYPLTFGWNSIIDMDYSNNYLSLYHVSFLLCCLFVLLRLHQHPIIEWITKTVGMLSRAAMSIHFMGDLFELADHTRGCSIIESVAMCESVTWWLLNMQTTCISHSLLGPAHTVTVIEMLDPTHAVSMYIYMQCYYTQCWVLHKQLKH